MTRLFISTFFVIILALPAQTVAAAATPLLPHKAIYEVKLVSIKSGAQIVGIGGTMNFSWKPSCAGYITDHNFTLRYDYADAPTSIMNSNYATFESIDGKTMQFSSRQIENKKLIEQISGKATAAEANFTMPKTINMKFKDKIIFPTKHTLTLLAAAQAGEMLQNSHVFDGGDTNGPLEISSIITQAPNGKIWLKDNTKDKSIDPALLSGKTWLIRMGFFNENQIEPDANYEMTLLLHENGVISDMIIDYADFSISQKLVSLNTIQPDHCGPSAKP
jgi:hypothetical protein